MSRYVWLSFPLGMSDPRPPAIPAPELLPFMSIEKNGANVQILKTANHTGTHVDAPRHVIEDGLCITDFESGEFMFTRPVLVDLKLSDGEVVMPKHLVPWKDVLHGADLALFRFGYESLRWTDPERFSTRCPGFGIESARWLRESCPDLRAVGMDVPSLACIADLDNTMASHNELLSGEGRRFLVIEEMHLDQDLCGLTEVRLCPWLVRGMDSGPCSVVGVIG